MAGSSKGKYFCWSPLTRMACPNAECAYWPCKVELHPHACPVCQSPLDYRCRFKLVPDARCHTHNNHPKGPAAWGQQKPPEPQTVVERMAERMAPSARALFGELLAGTPAEILRHMAAKSGARMLDRSSKGTLSPDQEAVWLGAVTRTLTEEAKVRLIYKELDPPKLQDVGVLDYGKLSLDQLDQLDALLALAAVNPDAAKPAALVAARRAREMPTGEQAWYGAPRAEPPAEVVKVSKRVAKKPAQE